MNPTFPVQVFLILSALGLGFYALESIRRKCGPEWLRWNQVLPLNLNGFEVLVIVLAPSLAVSLATVVLKQFSPHQTYLAYPLFPLAAFACACFYLRKSGIDPLIQWGLLRGRFSFRPVFSSFIALFFPVILATLFSSAYCSWLGHEELEQPTVKILQESGNAGEVLFLLLGAVVIAPLWEEIVFRGVLYPWLKKVLPRKNALLLGALIFAAFHFHSPSFLPLAVLGLGLALLYEYSGSLFSCIALHALFNFATCLNLMFSRLA